MQFCKLDISKSIEARSFKLGQLIEDDERITWCSLKKNDILLKFLPLGKSILVGA